VKTILAAGRPQLVGGWKPDLADHRDFVMQLPSPEVSAATLRDRWLLAIRNQGNIGTCTANGSLEAEGWLSVRAGKPDPVLSRLFQYWNTRVKIENVAATNDSGCTIRDSIKTLAQIGACAESLWPYSDDPNTFTLTPPQECFDVAAQKKALFFYRCPDLNTIKASIAQGFPVVFGFNVPQNFESDECAATGIIQMPTAAEEYLGGHCMLFAGWDDARQQLDGPNSWGADWGDQGWFHMPYGMVEQSIVSDAWTLRRVLL
jgi:C1A family cysteine protease